MGFNLLPLLTLPSSYPADLLPIPPIHTFNSISTCNTYPNDGHVSHKLLKTISNCVSILTSLLSLLCAPSVMTWQINSDHIYSHFCKMNNIILVYSHKCASFSRNQYLTWIDWARWSGSVFTLCLNLEKPNSQL